MKFDSKAGGRSEEKALVPEKDEHGDPYATKQGASGRDAAPDEASNGGGDEIRARLEAENADLKDRLLRALADAENVRRRSEREVSDARQYAVTEFARDIITVIDNFERALASVSTGEYRAADASGILTHGLQLTMKELQRTLERHGVRKIDPLGERFDPNLHEALFEIPDAESPPGTVAQVVSPGYTIGARVLRPAKVGVAADPKPS